MMLYTRQIVILLVGLYTVRVVLNTLGIDDYGIYSVVGGIVSFFAFLSATMASATQRFFSFALGQNDLEKLKKTFTINWVIYGFIAIIASILLETVGLWFINEKLQVPADRFDSVLLVFHFSSITFITTILTTPFMSIIIAHEDMQIYAYLSIVESVMKLALVFLLVYIPGDKLELYSALLLGVSLVNMIIYIGICINRYKECQFRKFYWEKELMLEIVAFTSWTLFGQLSSVMRNQAITILLNQMFTPAVVAARAVATNITSRINVFSNNFNVGLYPPIIKSYATGKKEEMFSLLFNGSKITFFLMWVFALPMLLEMETILKLWLKTPPPEAVLFTRLSLVEILINSLSLPMTTAARAPGKMKTYELTLGSIQISIFLVAWIILKLGAPAYSVFIVAIVVTLIMFSVRLVIVRNLIGLPIKSFLNQVIFRVLLIALFSAVPSYIFHAIISKELFSSIISIFSSIIFSSINMYFWGLDKKWRNKLRHAVTYQILKALNIESKN